MKRTAAELLLFRAKSFLGLHSPHGDIQIAPDGRPLLVGAQFVRAVVLVRLLTPLR